MGRGGCSSQTSRLTARRALDFRPVPPRVDPEMMSVMRSPFRTGLRGVEGNRALIRLVTALAFVLVALAAPTSAWAAPPGLVASYSFDEGSGLTVGDSSGNGHAGTITGATWATGRYGGGLDFNGTNASVDLGALGTLYQTGFTLEAWVQKQSATKNDVAIVGTWTRQRRTDDLGRPHRDPLPPDDEQRNRELPRLRPQPNRRAMATPRRHLRRHHRTLLHRRHRSRQPPQSRAASAAPTTGGSAPTEAQPADSSTA